MSRIKNTFLHDIIYDSFSNEYKNEKLCLVYFVN